MQKIRWIIHEASEVYWAALGVGMTLSCTLGANMEHEL